MRIYSRKEFLGLPEGTIYAKGKRWYFNGFSVKGETFGNDWAELSVMWIDSQNDSDQWSRLEGMHEGGASYPMAEGYGRDGCFDDEDIFLVPERADLEKLRGMIDKALSAVAVPVSD